MTRGSICKGIAALAAGLALLGTGRADTPPPRPPITIHGIVTTADGKPAPGVVLYLLDLPGGYSTPPISAEETRVVTDDAGHFTWSVPTDVLWNVVTPFSAQELNTTAVPAYWLPSGPSWTVTPEVHPLGMGVSAQMQQSDISQLFEQATVRCTTHYLTAGNDPQMSVVLPKSGEGIITLRLRGPDGHPLARRLTQIVAATDSPSFFDGTLVYSSVTNADGKLILPWTPGLCRLRITVPEVGFGTTGTFALRPNQNAAPPVPPLVPWATVSGTVAPSLLKPGETVQVQEWTNSHPWAEPTAPVNARGQFTIMNVFSGDYHVVLHQRNKEYEMLGVPESARFTVKPGQHLTGILVSPPPHASAPPPPSVPMANTNAATPLVGHVFTADGKPVAGASVWAVYSVSNFNGVGTASATVTDASGAYSFSNLRPGLYSATIYAVAPGHPFATAVTHSIIPVTSPGRLPNGLTADVILPDAHTGLAVHVLQDGKPAGAGVNVAVSSADASGGLGIFVSDASQTLDQLLRPSSVTNATGTVFFQDLPPGLWTVSGNNSVGSTRSANGSFNDSTAPSFRAKGVPITTGAPTVITVSLLPPAPKPSFRPLKPDGTAPTGPQANYEVRTGAGTLTGNVGTQYASDGTLLLDEATPGLYQVRPILRDGASPSFSSTTEPYDAATGLLAVSPALPAAPPLVLHTVRFRPGSIRVHLIGPNGRPARGTVIIGDIFHPHQYGASTDARGEVVFPNMPSGKYTLHASILGQPAAPSLGQGSAPFPSDAVLSHVIAFAPQTVTVTSNATASVTFTAQRMGYLRGHLVAPPDVVRQCFLWPNLPGDNGGPDEPPKVRYDQDTGEYLVGPLLPGKTELDVERDVTGGNNIGSSRSIPVTIPNAGGVLHQNLTPPPPSAKPQSTAAYGITGTVLLSNGTTPAWGARAALLLPNRPNSISPMQADARGQLFPVDSWFFGNSSGVPPGGVTSPTVVVWLPGTAGAVLAPYNVDAPTTHFVLPAPCTATGRVTVAGQSTAALPSTFKIEARPEDRGQLDNLLTVTVTAQADGTFTLPGLSAGTYQVQAARDNLWLSDTQTLTILAAGTAPPPLSLDIPVPGQTVTLHLTDPHGHPLPLFTLTLPQPPGPLADRFWPSAVTTDGAGDLTLPGLTAGDHALQVPSPTPGGQPTSLPFTVPALGGPIPPVQTLMVPATAGTTIGTGD